MLDSKEKVGHAVHFLGIDALPVLGRYCHQIVVAPGAWLQLVQPAVSAQCCNVHSIEVNLVEKGIKVIKARKVSGAKSYFVLVLSMQKRIGISTTMVMDFEKKDNYAQNYTNQCLPFH